MGLDFASAAPRKIMDGSAAFNSERAVDGRGPQKLFIADASMTAPKPYARRQPGAPTLAVHDGDGSARYVS